MTLSCAMSSKYYFAFTAMLRKSKTNYNFNYAYNRQYTTCGFLTSTDGSNTQRVCIVLGY